MSFQTLTFLVTAIGLSTATFAQCGSAVPSASQRACTNETPIALAAYAESNGTGEREQKSRSSKDIVDTAIASGSFETLVAAVQAAGLVDALKSDGPFTVFAPTDEAFANHAP